ncbi:protein jag [Ornithinimicrobium sp. LYQ92]|uniref:Jag family protein n=1 Tax=Serinicoccus sp. LYQ92 TaxID=3378798 RepID=UPI0038528589
MSSTPGPEAPTETPDDVTQVIQEDAVPDEHGGAATAGTETPAGTDSETDTDTGTLSGSSASTSSRDDLVREGEVAADFLETLLDIADLDGDLEVDVEGDRAAVAIVDSEDGAAPRTLVGPSGSVLEALQELTRLAVQADTGERSRLMLDVAGHRAGRRSALVEQARSAIAEVQSSGERRELDPMTAFERKVVHDEVLAAGLSSSSEGAEPSRYVVIQPAD